ncbi:uncharacterized protein CC84DRAFT_50769 [Paraphaeosphaeria sporulosa]|uniref:Major facilitator superfamily (MFS) profile domain-containing protein n=1 Tax=Paraphaeosphaeria sporulosa TaxID=1460663 RepID=A0A177CW40_9PLEO|nr:uncharacterized protein CC84DRAFT_50769 [Paraphaeosphaeria sporulosa]OAG11765.1 hypothetical protein CC84DRAFT_50769 [Paraphaeosphaeria sporulosa]
MLPYMGLRGKSLKSAISLVCGLCFLCFGYAQGVMGGLLTVPAFLERFPQVDTINNDSYHNATIQGAVVGTWNLGCFVSAILTIFLGDYLGRKKTLMIGLVFWVIGEIIQSSSYSFGQFIAGRAIAGFGNGFTTATVPAYQAECVKSHRKGTILMISAGAFIAFGLALSYWVVFGFAYLSNFAAAWRVPIAFQIIFALVALAILIFMPESPRWLILTGREDEALRVLSALNDEDIEGPEIRDEFLQIKDAILIMAKGSASSMTSNRERRNFHRMVLAYGVQVFQQMSGINLALQYLAIMMYTQFSYAGWLARLLGACAASFYFLSSFTAVVGIDRFWGRRWLMLFGATGMCACMVLLTVLGYLWQDRGMKGTNIAQTVFLFAYLFFFAMGWQGMAWLYQVEVVPLRIRGPANALSTSANWLFNFVVVFIGPIAFHNISWRTYIIFAATNFAIVPLVYFFYPETAYRSLEEVDVLFHLANEGPGNPWLSVVKISLNEPLWFGKKGDAPFDYEQSDWHQRYVQLMGSGSGTTLEGSGGLHREKAHGNGGSSGGTEGRNTPNAAGLIEQAMSHSNNSPGSSATHSSLSEKRHKEQYAAHTAAHRSSTGTGTTAVSLTPSKRPPLPDEPVHSFQSAHSAHSDPNWAGSALAPPPLRVPSRDSSLTARSNSLSHSRSQSISYPRVPSGGITRTESGRQTYLPDGIASPENSPESLSAYESESQYRLHYLPDSVEAQMREVLGRSGVVLGEGERVIIAGDGRAVVRAERAGSRSSSFSHRVARDAGRGH